ncbi:IS30 family transposase, partial [Enterococcus faecalis]|nr:IS30 family transposase [Enterococcus faecium]NSP57850.1 IS30 family transposase [Enterococcus faecalis]NSS85174.1 IS30 family transposase [Enterococcus faecalis]NSS96346.1 IS30 family transposase [Enterococcus faecalis]NST60273.1 IS30 family transposase [Enterococcus faecalis]
IASKRNNIPRKSLNYKTPIEVFLSHICKEELSNLI